MSNINPRLAKLLDLYLHHTVTASEQDELWDYVEDPLYAQQLEELLSSAYQVQRNGKGIASAQQLKMLEQIFASVDQSPPIKNKIHRLWPRIAVAASMVAAICLGGYFYKQATVPTPKLPVEFVNTNDIAPGKEGATLTLANGRKILINDALTGNIATQTGVKISKTADGQIVYEVVPDHTQKLTYNTLSTTRGEQTKLRLPDGTLVFLNAASSLKYPTIFSNERKVELSGEAYFEVAHHKAKPFKVLSNGQEVKVLGTHFNINSYEDETATRTTLLEGSVAISSLRGTASPDHSGKQSQKLNPNQQATLTPSGNLTVQPVKADELIAWTQGKFVFDREDIASVMRKLSRWYNVEIAYQGNLQGKTFSGSVSRASNISKILEKIAFTEAVHFKIEGRRVTIMP